MMVCFNVQTENLVEGTEGKQKITWDSIASLNIRISERDSKNTNKLTALFLMSWWLFLCRFFERLEIF